MPCMCVCNGGVGGGGICVLRPIFNWLTNFNKQNKSIYNTAFQAKHEFGYCVFKTLGRTFSSCRRREGGLTRCALILLFLISE